MDRAEGYSENGGFQAGSDIERFYKVAFDETDTAIFISRPDGKCIVVNQRGTTLTGYSRQELIGREILDLFQAQDQDFPMGREGFPKGKTTIAEGRLQRKDGHMLMVELHIRKLPDGNFLQSIRAITEQKLPEEMLRKNVELFRIAFDYAPTGRSIIAPDGRTYLAVNPLLCEMFGYTKEEFLGQTIQLVTHPDDVERSNEWIRKKINDEPCEPVFEKRFIHKDGHIVWGLVRAHWIKDEAGAVLMAVAHIQDITEQKEAEEERKNLQTRLAAAMELAHLGPWEYDIDSDTFTFNDHFYRLFRTSAEEVGGYTMSSADYASRFVHPDDLYLVEQEIRKTIETSDPNFNRKIDHRIIYHDGMTGYINVHYFIEKDEHGRTVKTFGINQDITERKQAEEERRKLEDQMRQAQKMESIGLLAGGVAHDFNNLLSPILGYADILSHGLADEDQRQRQLNHIRSAAERAKDVAQQLLAFSRKQLLELKTVHLGDIIGKFENMLRRTIRENIEIKIKIFPNLCMVKADPGTIEQVLLNLSINAQDAMPGGGHLMIEAQNIDLDPSDTSEYRDIQPGPYAMLSVKDTGIGMDDETVKHIFEPFYTTKEPGKGTGLGLSTVYGIVKQHGGFISVSSEMGRGSTFKLFLPQAAREEEMEIEKDLCPTADIACGQETILVAEDNEIVRSLTCDMLDSLGYSVLVAENPEGCIDLAKKHLGVIHLLLTDVIMPKMNGKELYDVLHGLQPDLKVVFMSGYASNLIGHQSIIEQETNFIQKPFSLSELSDIIRRALDSVQTG